MGVGRTYADKVSVQPDRKHIMDLLLLGIVALVGSLRKDENLVRARWRKMMNALFKLLLVEVFCSAVSAQVPVPTPAPAPFCNEFNVLDYGAKGDGVTDDSQALLATWKLACHVENSTMLLPRGRTFVATSILFVGPCTMNFHLKIDGIVMAPRDVNKWTKLANWISIAKVHGFSLDGDGIIDGQGDVWWMISCRRNRSYACQKHPTALSIRASSNILIQNLKFVNSPQMHLSVEESFNVSIKGLEIVAPHDSPNTDGIHLHMSRNVSIEKCIVGTGDDCISVGRNCSDIVVKELICGPGHGISVGSLGKNKTPEYVTGVRVENSILVNTMYGLRIKTWQGGLGFASNLSYYNVVMMDVLHPIIIDQYYCDSDSSFTCGTEDVDAVKVSNVSYANIMGTSASNVALRFQCSQNNPCNNLVLENVFLHLANGSIPSAVCLNAFGENKGMVVPNSCLNNTLAR